MPRSLPKPLSSTERAARAHARQQEAGWRRVTLRLPPEVARLLARHEARYGSAVAAVSEALRRLREP